MEDLTAAEKRFNVKRMRRHLANDALPDTSLSL